MHASGSMLYASLQMINCYFFMQESLSRCGKETILYNNNQKEAMKKFGQTSLMLGVFVVAAFTVKQLFK